MLQRDPSLALAHRAFDTYSREPALLSRGAHWPIDAAPLDSTTAGSPLAEGRLKATNPLLGMVGDAAWVFFDGSGVHVSRADGTSVCALRLPIATPPQPVGPGAN